MKVIKRGLFLMVALGFEVGVLGPALAAPNPLPVNGTYSFSMVGANVNALTDVPTTAATGVFTVTEVGTTSFNVTNGELMLNDDRNVCIAHFSGTGTPAAAGLTSGTMALTLSNLSGPNCDSLSPGRGRHSDHTQPLLRGLEHRGHFRRDFAFKVSSLH